VQLGRRKASLHNRWKCFVIPEFSVVARSGRVDRLAVVRTSSLLLFFLIRK
jgi:hypothetical protein